MSNDQYIVINGKIRRADLPIVGAGSRGLMYGDGCFETLCSYRERFFKLETHLNRLERGLNYLGIDYPRALKVQRLKKSLRQLLTQNDLEDKKAVIRIQVWREGRRGYGSRSHQASYAITATAHSGIKKAYTLCSVSAKRIPSAALPSEFKFSNGINYIKAANEAQKNGADDALMETVQGWVSETTIANIFWKQESRVFTPSTDCDILPGITRQIIIKLLQSAFDIRVTEGQFAMDTLKKAESVWICNSVKEIALVTRVDDTSFKTKGPFLDKLRQVYQQYLQTEFSREG